MIVQGDIYFVAAILPNHTKRIKHNGRLKEGEHTGHCHEISEQDLAKVEFWEDEKGTLWLRVLKETLVIHQEHKTVTLPEGDYFFDSQIEDDPFEDEIREIKD